MVMPVGARMNRQRQEGLVTRVVTAVFTFFRYAEFEILFMLFFFIAFLIFKNLTSGPEYNQILVKKSDGINWWPY